MAEPQTASVAARHEKPVRHYHHGRSPAAWTGVIVAGLGFVVATVGIFVGSNWSPNWIVIGVGAAIVLLGMIAGGVLKAAGYGNN